MEEFPDLLCLTGRNLRNGSQFFGCGRHDILYGAEAAHQGLFAGGAHAGNSIEPRGDLGLAAQGPVVLDGKAVGLILNACNELESLS